MKRMFRNALYGTFSAIAVAVVWGLSFVAARVVLSTLTPILLATVRFSIASLIFFPILLIEFRKGNRLRHRDLAELFLLGLLSISVYFWLQYTGVKYVGAGVSALLVVGLTPIITGLASAFVLKENYSIRQVLGTIVGLLGVVLTTMPGLFVGKVDWLFYLGVLCLLLNSLCWALYSTLSRRFLNRVTSSLMVTSYVTVLGTLGLIPMSLASDWGLVKSLQLGQWLSIFYLSFGCSCMGYFLWNFSLSRMEAIRVAVWMYLEPVAAFIGEALIFGMVPSEVTMIGGGAIIAGALLTSWSGHSHRVIDY